MGGERHGTPVAGSTTLVGDLSLSLEDARARTFRRMRNIFSLCVVAHLFVTRVFVVGRRPKPPQKEVSAISGWA